MTNSNITSNEFRFYSKVNHDLIAVSKIELDSNFKIQSVTDADGNNYSADELYYTNLVLSVPGLGNALCGDLITIKVKNKISEYELGFGWHINISNQQLYSWYLLPKDKHLNTPDEFLTKAKTLYYDDLINIIGITRQLPGILPSDINNEIVGGM